MRFLLVGLRAYPFPSLYGSIQEDQLWLRTRFVLRSDSSFCRNLLLSWCGRNEVMYIVGLARHSRLLEESEELIQSSRALYESTGKRQRLIDRFDYAAGAWSRIRSVVVKALQANPRFMVTNIVGNPMHPSSQRIVP